MKPKLKVSVPIKALLLALDLAEVALEIERDAGEDTTDRTEVLDLLWSAVAEVSKGGAE